MVKRKVLLIETDEELASMAERFLGRSDFEVAIAKDGLHGLQLASDLNPHLVLIELTLDSSPDGGIKLGKSFRHDLQLKRIPLVLMVPDNFDEHRAERVEAANRIFDGLLYKPFADTELKRVVENFTGFGESGTRQIEALDGLLENNSSAAEDTDVRNLIKDLRDKTKSRAGENEHEPDARELKKLLKERDRTIKERDKRIEKLLSQLSDLEMDHSFAIESLESEKAALTAQLDEMKSSLAEQESRLAEAEKHIEETLTALKPKRK